MPTVKADPTLTAETAMQAWSELIGVLQTTLSRPHGDPLDLLDRELLASRVRRQCKAYGVISEILEGAGYT